MCCHAVLMPSVHMHMWDCAQAVLVPSVHTHMWQCAHAVLVPLAHTQTLQRAHALTLLSVHIHIWPCAHAVLVRMLMVQCVLEDGHCLYVCICSVVFMKVGSSTETSTPLFLCHTVYNPFSWTSDTVYAGNRLIGALAPLLSKFHLSL